LSGQVKTGNGIVGEHDVKDHEIRHIFDQLPHRILGRIQNGNLMPLLPNESRRVIGQFNVIIYQCDSRHGLSSA
jgi:hypothetical protein